MEDIERAAKGPGKHELAISSDSTVRSDAVGTLKDPVLSAIVAALWSEEVDSNMMESSVKTPMCQVEGEVWYAEKMSRRSESGTTIS